MHQFFLIPNYYGILIYILLISIIIDFSNANYIENVEINIISLKNVTHLTFKKEAYCFRSDSVTTKQLNLDGFYSNRIKNIKCKNIGNQRFNCTVNLDEGLSIFREHIECEHYRDNTIIKK